MAEVIERIKEILNGPLLEAGYELYEAKLIRGKEGTTLQIIVDRPSPISLDDIVKVSDLINPLLDEADPIDGPYTLDVSSLGAEKPIALERLGAYEGRYIHLHLSTPYQGANDLEGELVALSETELTLRIRDKSKTKSVVLGRQSIDKARLAIKF